ncbi:hypothetical protein [Symbiopectobacterium sp. RP]|uniref:hypothetical protein n=1 Tax=Symbiopectobacterium sp. RP TaxID=3248553 RepID=UPI003D27AC57
MADIFRGKITRNKSYQVFGYAVTPKGYTRSAQVMIEAISPDDAIIRAAAQLRREGLTHFKALKVLDISMPIIRKRR